MTFNLMVLLVLLVKRPNLLANETFRCDHSNESLDDYIRYSGTICVIAKEFISLQKFTSLQNVTTQMKALSTF